MSNKEYTKEYLQKNIKPLLVVGAKIKIGKRYAKEIGGFNPGEVITLVQGYFECYNGLYDETQTAPSIWDECNKEFDSIYHLFGNGLENWYDCEIENNKTMTSQERIKADAEAYANGIGDVYRKYAAQYGYIAGATAENDRAQVLVDALELIEANSELPGIKSFATTAIEQWKSGKGKEVGDD